MVILFCSPCKKLSLKDHWAFRFPGGRVGIKGFLERSVLLPGQGMACLLRVSDGSWVRRGAGRRPSHLGVTRGAPAQTPLGASAQLVELP